MLKLNYLILTLIPYFLLIQSSKAQLGSEKIYLEFDFNQGFWQTPDNSIAYAENPIRKRNSLLAFKLKNGITYSTGVNDAMLTANNVNFISGNYRSLPVEDVYFFGGYNVPAPVGSYTFFAFPAEEDNSPALAINPYFTFPDYKISVPLSMGTKGLDIGTMVTNVPGNVGLTFKILTPEVQINGITDEVPDIIITQEAQPSTNDATDKMWFEDENGNRVGNIIEVKVSSDEQFPKLGKLYLDFFRLQPGTPSWEVNSSRDAKLFTVKLSEFGINENNRRLIKFLKYDFNGSSDPGMIAYNENTFRFVPLNSFPDEATTDRQLPVTINVLANDQYDSTEVGGEFWKFEITEQPSAGKGSAVIVDNKIIYTPEFNNISSPVVFKYKICDSFGCAETFVNVQIKNTCTRTHQNFSQADSFTTVGISTLSQEKGGQIDKIPNAYLAMESTDKGMVITRTSAAAIPNPIEGMIVYDTVDRCIKLYNGSNWNCIQATCKE